MSDQPNKTEPVPIIIDHEDGDQTRVVAIPVRMPRRFHEKWKIVALGPVMLGEEYYDGLSIRTHDEPTAPQGRHLILHPRVPQLTETEAWIVKRMKEGKLDLPLRSKWLSYRPGGVGWVASIRDTETEVYGTGARRTWLDRDVYEQPPTPAEPTLIDLTRLREIAGAE